MNYIVLQNENALYYECKFSCDNAIFLSLGKERFFITDSRYEIEAKERVEGATVVISKNLLDELIATLKSNKVKKVAIDPIEWDLYSFRKVKESLPLKFSYKPAFSHNKRIIKSAQEIEYLREAVKIGRKSFKAIAKALTERQGASEQELNFLAESILRDFGRRDISFEPILALSENAAKPHALPTERKLQLDDLILLDAGVKYKRYCSDRTRTAYYNGETLRFNYKQHFSDKKIQKAYDTVLKAHDKAIAKARCGMTGSEIDKIARDVIEKAGFGKEFVHSTGHGVGLDIHEMPYISAKSTTVIEDAMVFTIEPGIYIADAFGIRIEDMVVMQNGRAEVL
ncbi:MAG TPA: M24 family metallopeptidase [Nitratifractor sp.]|nr:M24 family metallopeptidase [Nitratifractor sp.]